MPGICFSTRWAEGDGDERTVGGVLCEDQVSGTATVAQGCGIGEDGKDGG